MRRILILLALSSFFAQAETIENALNSCSKEENALKRLVCYDRVVKDLNQYEGVNKQAPVALPTVTAKPTQPVYVAEPVEPVKTSSPVAKTQAKEPASEFGLEAKKKTNQVDKIYGEVVEVAKSPYKKMIITLADGQVWRQTDNTSLRIREGDQVYVERGALGSFYLSKDSAKKRLKVKRTK